MTVTEAQGDIDRAFVGGGPGVFVSGLVWIAAAAVDRVLGAVPAFAVLFFGGMLIFPVGALASRFLFRRERQSPANPLGGLALESTIAMIAGLFAAWLFLPIKPGFVFPLAAVAVGTHYAVFKSIYGDRLFWLLGALVTAVGVLSIYRLAPIHGGPILAVGAIELVFAVLLTWRAVRPDRPSA